MYIVLTIVSIVNSTVYTIYFVYHNWFLIENKDLFTKYNTRNLVNVIYKWGEQKK